MALTAGGSLTAHRVPGVGRLACDGINPHPVGDMGRTVVIDQGFAGLVLQLFQGGCSDSAHARHVSLGLQMTGTFAQNAKSHVSHGLIPSLSAPSLTWFLGWGGGAGYGEPSCQLPGERIMALMIGNPGSGGIPAADPPV